MAMVARNTFIVGIQQLWVIAWNKHTNCKRSEDVEEENTPEDSANSLGNILARILSFTGSDSNHFHATIAEGSVDERGEEA
jgi:hypothetical protein